MQPTLQDNQMMSKHRVLSLKPQLRLEWRRQDGQNETEQPDHSASLGDSITSSTQIRFSVHTGSKISPSHSHKPECPAASSDGRTPNPSRDSFRSSRKGPSRQSPPPQTAPDASPVATRLPTAAEEIRSGGQSCGNYSSVRHSLQWRIIAPILSQRFLSR